MPNGSGYPFLTRKQIVARLVAEPAFMTECAGVIQARTEQRAAGSAPAGKAWGWMSSERVVAGRLTAKSRIGMLSVEDESRLTKLIARYSRQLADHFRSLAIGESPGLSVSAGRFGVGPTASDPSDISRGPPQPKEIPSRYHPKEDCPADELESDPEMDIEGDPQADSATDDDELPRRVLEFVQGSPGELSETIARALSTTTAMVAPTLRMLVQGGRLRKDGVGRGTRYLVR